LPRVAKFFGHRADKSRPFDRTYVYNRFSTFGTTTVPSGSRTTKYISRIGPFAKMKIAFPIAATYPESYEVRNSLVMLLVNVESHAPGPYVSEVQFTAVAEFELSTLGLDQAAGIQESRFAQPGSSRTSLRVGWQRKPQPGALGSRLHPTTGLRRRRDLL
jgi:hypothetical protein